MSASRKTWNVGVIGLRTDDSSNPLSEDEGYEHISVMQPLVGNMSPAHLKKLQQDVKVSETNSGDAISAVIVAIQMITAFTKKLKYQRKIVLVTNGRGNIDADNIDGVWKKLNEDEIQLVVLCVVPVPLLSKLISIKRRGF